jgi:hypothetical protein
MALSCSNLAIRLTRLFVVMEELGIDGDALEKP